MVRMPRSLAFVSTIVLCLSTFGCATQVSGGGDGGDGSGGEGGAAACTVYDGDACKPYDTRDCGSDYVYMGVDEGPLQQSCEPVSGTDCTTKWGPCEANTPLVLSFDDAPVEYRTDRDRSFDISGVRSQVTDWPTAKTPWLALDRDGNGRIDDGGELFGSMTVLSSGRHAPNGFAALRELDADGDGRITRADAGFSRLLVWSDGDADRLSSSTEIASAAAWELISIDLAYVSDPRCDARGNCEVERAPFLYRDAAGVVRTGAVVDIHLAVQR